MIKRSIEKSIKGAAKQYPVVTLTGPRQSGKTTLVRALFNTYDYVSLEDPELRSFALEDPRGFLQQFKKNVILDEVQRTPELFSYIQTIVDEEDSPGRFILTGSQNFLLLSSISQTLAGRCAIYHLLPLSQDEIVSATSLAVGHLGQIIPTDRPTPVVDLNTHLFQGFYPRIHDKKLEPQDWLKNYYRTYLERDVREITNIGDLEAFRRFTALCAGRSGQLLNLSNLASDCGITHTTARRWLSVLEASFLVILLRPHHRNFRKRMVKTPKLYFLDTGLLCYLLRIKKPEDLTFHAARGAIFESFVVSEFYKKALNAGQDPDYFFWRDSAGNEVDIIIDLGNAVIPVEVKAGATVVPDFFKGIDYWKKVAEVDEESPAALIYGGNSSVSRKGAKIYSWWNF